MKKLQDAVDDGEALRVLLSTSRLEQLACRTANAARWKKRAAFQERYGSYVKCGACGGFVYSGPGRDADGDKWRVPCPTHGYAFLRETGYAPPLEP